MITVVPLGPGSPDLLTSDSVQKLHSGNLFLRTARHPVADALTSEQIGFQSFDALYDEYEDFDELHRDIASRLLKLGAQEDLIYAVPDPVTDASVRILQSQNKVAVRILPGVSLTAYYLSSLPQPFCPSSALCTCSAMDFVSPDSDRDLLLTELHSRQLAGDIKILLSDIYDEETSVVFFSCDLDLPAVIPLYALDRQKSYNHTSAVFVPSIPFEKKVRFTFNDLMHIMYVLRSQDGCPWDQEQTHQSLRKYLLEEAYEAAGAIDEDDPDHLCDELGDVLLQVAFHASIAESCTEFSRTDITSAICRKMMRRHPKIFGHTTDLDADETWENVKKEERGFSSVTDSLSDVSPALPALTRAAKIQKRAGKAGTDFASAQDALQAAAELIQDIMKQLENHEDPTHTLGCLLYICAAAARLSRIDPEETLDTACSRFIHGFSEAENAGKKSGKAQNPLTIREMIVYLRTAH